MKPIIPMPDSVSVVLFAPAFREAISKTLEAHGGKLDGLRACFPNGTTKYRLFAERWAIVFPDQFTIEMIELSGNRNILIVRI